MALSAAEKMKRYRAKRKGVTVTESVTESNGNGNAVTEVVTGRDANIAAYKASMEGWKKRALMAEEAVKSLRGELEEAKAPHVKKWKEARPGATGEDVGASEKHCRHGLLYHPGCKR
jgi:hypothetical protein